jgi:hypothetical protein
MALGSSYLAYKPTLKLHLRSCCRKRIVSSLPLTSLSSTSCCRLCWIVASLQSEECSRSYLCGMPMPLALFQVHCDKSSCGTYCLCNGSVHQLHSLVSSGRRIHSAQHSERVADCLMHPFTNRICLRILRRCTLG